MMKKFIMVLIILLSTHIKAGELEIALQEKEYYLTQYNELVKKYNRDIDNQNKSIILNRQSNKKLLDFITVMDQYYKQEINKAYGNCSRII